MKEKIDNPIVQSHEFSAGDLLQRANGKTPIRISLTKSRVQQCAGSMMPFL
jgi:hypothetical protein